jgi:outer membrane protein assembly factor BamB
MRTITILSLVGLLTSSAMLRAEDWPCWRGPGHEGISAEKFKTNWAEQPKVLWEKTIGSGFSAFACVKDRVYTCGTEKNANAAPPAAEPAKPAEGEKKKGRGKRGGSSDAGDTQQVLFCFDAATGNVIWKVPFEKGYPDGQGGNGTRSTPVVDEGRVYIIGGWGLVLCVDAADGKEIWRKQLNDKPHWGYAGSVLIEKDMAIFPAGGEDDGAFMAADKKTGTLIWKCANDKPGYSTPYPFDFNGKRYVFCYAAKAGLIADIATGKLVCRMPWETDFDVNAAQPNFQDGLIFLATGYNTGCALYKLTPKGDQLAAEEVWRSKVLMPKFTSCVLKDGVLYAGDQKGMRAVDFKTGKELWSERLTNASILMAGEWLIVQTENGDVLVAKASPKGFKSVGKASPLTGRSWTVPTLANGKLYVRNLEKAVCLDVKP